MNIQKINPYYNPESLNLKMITFEEPGLSYEFNILCFWVTEEGNVYTASAAGCSCPEPFENYYAKDQKEALQLLERVGSKEQAFQILKSWDRNNEIKDRDIHDLDMWLTKNSKLDS